MKPFTILCVFALLFCTSCKAKNNEQLSAESADTSIFKLLSSTEKEYFAQKAKDDYEKILGPNFNGEILIAKDGQIVFEDYRGVANFRTRAPITPETSMHLASISKTFTGMAILHLWEEGKLSLDDNVKKYFPKFPYQGITIRLLLSHRSGLPNYLNFMSKGFPRHKKATNQDVINYMIAHKPRVSASPDRMFQYCNTNFLLLASIVEKVTHQSYPRFMKDSVFNRLGMKHTYVFSIKDTASYNPTYMGNRPFPMNNIDCTYGDKNIYSTVRDLLKWDRSLYLHTFLKASTLKMAFTPQSHERPSLHNYGLAWRMLYDPHTGDTVIYHNGYWHGSNNVFMRFIKYKATIIVLGNKYNANNYKAKNIAEIFTGAPTDFEFEPSL